MGASRQTKGKELTKKEIRKECLAKREALPQELVKEYSVSILKSLVDLPEYHNAEELLCYVDYRNEVQTRILIEESLALLKKVYCPKIIKNPKKSVTEPYLMEFYEISSLSDLQEGYKGILEPVQSMENKWHRGGKHTLLIMPGVAFDQNCHRAGYGKGYYDRFLKAHEKEVFALALCFTCQLVEAVPTDSFDRLPQILLTEKGIFTP